MLDNHFLIKIMGLSLHLNTVIISYLIAFAILFFMYSTVQSSSWNSITDQQNFLEYLVEMFTDKVEKSYSVPDPFIISYSLFLFLWITGMNLCDLLPSTTGKLLLSLFQIKEGNFSIVPTEDLSLVIALGISTFFLINFFNLKNHHGPLGYLNHILIHPFGKYLLPANLFFNLLEQLIRPFGLIMRLFGNMFAGGIIFSILTYFIPVATFLGALCWSILHFPALIIQALLFAQLSISYVEKLDQSNKKLL
jgi:F-type H+-transporting ATPase subunit a